MSFLDHIKDEIHKSIDESLFKTLDSVDFKPPDKDPGWDFVGIPDVGTLRMGEGSYEVFYGTIDMLLDELIDEYLPEARKFESGHGLPCFIQDGHYIGVRNNWNDDGPSWSKTEKPFSYVLIVKHKEVIKHLLYGEDPYFLLWAGIDYVYADYDLNCFYDKFFDSLLL